MKSMSIKEACLFVLKQHQKQMHVSDILKEVEHLASIKSKTPKNTVNRALQSLDSVTRVGKGTFKYYGKNIKD